MAKDIRVTFHSSDEKLTAMFTEHFSSVKSAKEAMEMDAKIWCNAHDGKMKWKNPDSEDYLEAISNSGNLACIWQYFDL